MEENQEIRSAALDLDTLKTRAARCVCKYCGSPLKVERIMYHNCEAARSELFCPKCGRIEFGVEREVYLAAKYYVDTFHFNMYQGLEDNEQRRRYFGTLPERSGRPLRAGAARSFQRLS